MSPSPLQPTTKTQAQHANDHYEYGTNDDGDDRTRL